MADREVIIEVRGLTFGYAEREVISDISFEVMRGEIVCVIGGSGSGKSTLMLLLTGLIEPWSGSVRIGSEELIGAGPDERLALLSRIGVMFQSGALFGSRTIAENLRLPMEELTDLPTEAMDLIASLKLSLVDLSSTEHLLPGELSGGMQKRAAIARPMVLDPNLIFLDEPSSGLDPLSRRSLDDLIIRLRAALDITFVVVTHELSSIYAIADRVVLLDRSTGKVAATGRPEEVREHAGEEWIRRFMNRRED
jgi:phospholipid/cholesterol/gamma-HCH transport system ATP-binding protein